MSQESNKMSRRALFTGMFKGAQAQAVPASSAPAAEVSAPAGAGPEDQAGAKAHAELLERGLALFAAKDFEAAVDPLRTVVKADPENARARLCLGAAFYELGRDIHARVEFERLLHDKQELGPARLFLAATLVRMKRSDKILQALEGFADPERPAVEAAVAALVNAVENDLPKTPELAAPLAQAAWDRLHIPV